MPTAKRPGNAAWLDPVSGEPKIGRSADAIEGPPPSVSRSVGRAHADGAQRGTPLFAHRSDERNQDTMTAGLSVEVPVASARGFDVITELDELRAQVRSAEDKAAGLEHAVISNRRIGMAVGILMCQRRLPEEEAVELLMTHSQRCNVKVRELAEKVIFTGTL